MSTRRALVVVLISALAGLVWYSFHLAANRIYQVDECMEISIARAIAEGGAKNYSGLIPLLLYGDSEIKFEVCDLLQPVRGWLAAFDFVLEIYTIQPLPLDIRTRVIDSIASFVAPNGSLVVVTRGRENDVVPEAVPWPLSRDDLKRFEQHGLTEYSFVEMPPIENNEPSRFVVEYRRV